MIDYKALDICNKALRLVGQMPLKEDEFEKIQTRDDLDENKIINAVVRKLYIAIKDEVLDLCNWKIATKHCKLTSYEEDKNLKYSFKFLLPTDAIRVIDASSNFIRQGLYIFANTKILTISYIARIDEQEMNFRLVNLVALRLAMELCLCVLNDDDKLKTMEERFNKTLEFSKKLDATEENEEIEFLPKSKYLWIQSRR